MSFKSLLRPGVSDTFRSGYNFPQFRNDVFGGITAAVVMDPSAALAIDEMVELSIRHGRHVIVSGLRDSAMKALGGMGVLDRIPAAQQFELRTDAIEAAVRHCRSLESQTEPPQEANDRP